jgi:predicted MPP superfamily phosphohydrolase
MKKFILILLLIIVVVIIINLIQNSFIHIDTYSYESDRNNQKTEVKIIQLSDVHSGYGTISDEKIYKAIKSKTPDLIFITGDLIDSRIYLKEKDSVKYLNAGQSQVELVRELMKVAPVFYVLGNHEIHAYEDKEDTFLQRISETGAIILENESYEIELNSQKITIIGITDPFLINSTMSNWVKLETELKKIKIPDNNISILLSHRPEYLDLYSQFNIDLIFSGHAHGGQFRFPFIGGLFAPNQGFLPKYDKGVYYKDSSIMYLSAGTGNSVIPFRFFNPPHINEVIIK